VLFENEPDHRLFLLVSGIWEKSRRWADKQLRALNMTFPQFAALTALSQKDGITQRELAETVDTDATTVMVLCDSLEKKGWLRRQPDPNDRRVNRLVLTDSGKDAFATAYPLVRAGYEHVLGETRGNELRTAVKVLERLYRNAKELHSGKEVRGGSRKLGLRDTDRT